MKFYVKSGDQTTFFTKDEIVLSLSRPNPNDPPVGAALSPSPTKDGHPSYTAFNRKPKTANRKPAIVHIKPVGLKKGVQIAPLAQTGHRVNYFIGNDPKKWRTDIPTYQAVVYENAYVGIDLKFYGQGQQLEYDIVVQPGADPNQVQFAYQGVKKLEVTPEGDLVLVLPDEGMLLHKKPIIYQEVAGKRTPVEGKFRLCRSGAQVTCGFAVAAYDKKQSLVIDPVLLYSTYLGGSDLEEGYGIALDATGAAYVTGRTYSTNFPIQQAYQGTNAGYHDVFVTKLSPAGNALEYSTYLGGSDLEEGYGIAVDAAGAAYVTGWTNSENFPTHQAYKGTIGSGYDAFVSKLSPAGNALEYSTYLGGSGARGHGIAVDANGSAYITGYTVEIPTQQPYQSFNKGSLDAFVTKLSPSGQALVYSTYLGGRNEDFGTGIAVDAAGAAYVTGYTLSINFPTQQAYQGAKSSNYDAFVTKLSPAGNTLIYSTFLGGTGIEYCLGIAVDSTGAAYITGQTSSNNFPVHQAFQESFKGGYSDAFVTKLSPSGDTLIYSTYLGGDGDDVGRGIAVDSTGAAYVTGDGAFVSKLSPSGNAMAYSTYLGDARCRGIAVDSTGAAYITGETSSKKFPTHRAYQSTYGGYYDAFVTKLRQVGQTPFLPLLLGD